MTPQILPISKLLAGVQMGATTGNFAETMAALETSLNANEAISIVTQIDHQANAASIDQVLRPTCVTMFGKSQLK